MASTVIYRCLQTWVPLRKEKSSASEMVSSLLFGETCVLQAKEEDWLLVACTHDSYVGWIPEYYLVESTESWTRVVTSQGASLVSGDDRVHLSAGSNLPDTEGIEIQGSTYQLQRGREAKKQDIVSLAKGFLHVPYLWGGRSDCGMDCSGLTQVVYKMMGIDLPRDAYQQAEIGEPVHFGAHQIGDLAFFAKNGKITHVGIITNHDEIIHAHGKVRLDVFTKDGIVNTESKNITHTLATIKRIPAV